MLSGNKKYTISALHYKTKCLQLMGERLSNSGSGDVDEGTMYGALDLCNEAVS
jgi:hypothetical protein